MNLYTSRGDGNNSPDCSKIHSKTEIHLFTLQGDGKSLGVTVTLPALSDIIISTSRGDFFENFENSLDTASRKC